jgi:nucleoside permease NupC
MNFEFNLMYIMRGFLGIFILLGIAWLISFNRKKVNWKLVGSGMLLQFVFAFLILTTPQGRVVFEKFNGIIIQLLSFSDEGAGFVFGNLTNNFEIGAIFAFKVLPTIIFFSSMISVLYYLGVMQKVVEVFAWIMVKILGTSGAETLSCSANIFVGQTEAPLLIKPLRRKDDKIRTSYRYDRRICNSRRRSYGSIRRNACKYIPGNSRTSALSKYYECPRSNLPFQGYPP